MILIVLGSSGCSYQENLAPNENDPYEATNVIDQHPEIAQKLQAWAESHRNRWWMERN